MLLQKICNHIIAKNFQVGDIVQRIDSSKHYKIIKIEFVDSDSLWPIFRFEENFWTNNIEFYKKV